MSSRTRRFVLVIVGGLAATVTSVLGAEVASAAKIPPAPTCIFNTP
jgi:hypothetical protein